MRVLAQYARFLLVTFWAGDLPLFAGGEVATTPVRIYLANDDHTDFLWTANAATYERVFQEMIDYYLDLADETEDYPTPYQSRFNCDGSYWLRVYEQNRSTNEFRRVVKRLRSGHLSAPMTALVSCYGGQPTEAVLRGMYYAGTLERRYGLRFPLAVAMENQTLPLGLASLWAGSGARYSWRGVCACASKLPPAPLEKRPHEIYWHTGHDGQRVLMKWYSLAPQGNRHAGGYAEAFDPVASIAYLFEDIEFLRRYRPPAANVPYAIRGAFGFGWDALDRKTGVPYAPDPEGYPFTQHFHKVAQEHTTPARQIIVSNEEDFFRDFERHYGERLPGLCVTYGNEWDLYSASMTETSARVRRSVEKLRTAELLAALVSLAVPGFSEGFASKREEAFVDLGLYWEHDWTADGPVPREARAAWQVSLAEEIETYVDGSYEDAADRFGALIRKPDDATQRFFVLNPLSWTRSDAADLPYTGSKEIHIMDLTDGREVPHQFIRREGRSHLRVLAKNVPSTGYKVFEILSGPGTLQARPAATVSQGNSVLENDRVRIAADRDGAIRSLRASSLPGVEFAADIGGIRLNDLSPGETAGQPIVVEDAGPVSVTLKCQSDLGLPHTTRITLIRGCDRVDVHNKITANFADVRHWGFSFNLESPDVHVEEVGAIIRVKTKSAGGDYADTHARYDYATLNHFADISDGSNTRGVTLANSDCAFVRLGHSTPDALDTTTPQLNVLAGGQVDGPQLGIHAQNGVTHFVQRFSLRPHAAYDAVAAMRFALEHQNPLIAGVVTGDRRAPYPGTSYSLLKLSDPSTLLWALKPHEDGIDQGLIVRLWNLAARSTTCDLESTPALKAAYLTTHLETDLRPLALTRGKVSLPLAAHQMQTIRVLPED